MGDIKALRHSAEHVLMQAMERLYPGIVKAMGPATDEGFYFDFDPNAIKISEADFPKIEKIMRELINLDLPFIRVEISVEEAKKLFKNNPYKLEWIDKYGQEGGKVTIYWTGDPSAASGRSSERSFVDLCKGPHVASTGKIKALKLLSIAGAYWHGDEKNKMLTRIYGTAFETKEELDKYLWQMEEAKKRDHRKLGKEMDLFVVSEQIGGGLPIFTPKGTVIRKTIEDYLTNLKKENGYQFVWSPHIANSKIYHTSGHWGKYDAMFSPMILDDQEYVLKPMNCPHHFQIYLSKPRSYRDLPMRIAENGTVYRHEKSGELNGLLRVRSLTIDDTHTIMRLSQTNNELKSVLLMIREILEIFGFKNYKARISTHDPKNFSKYLGKKDEWERSEEALKRNATLQGFQTSIGEGEAAFYGPKIDIMVKDSLQREWQLSTVQLDYNQPHNFEMTYVDENGQKTYPAILHIAMIGSLERFIGILIEHYAGAFPTWLNPVQVKVLPIAERHAEYAKSVFDKLKKADIRVELDDRNETLGARIRDGQNQKVSYMLIVGDKEVESGMVSERARNGKADGPFTVETFIGNIKEEIEKKINT